VSAVKNKKRDEFDRRPTQIDADKGVFAASRKKTLATDSHRSTQTKRVAASRGKINADRINRIKGPWAEGALAAGERKSKCLRQSACICLPCLPNLSNEISVALI